MLAEQKQAMKEAFKEALAEVGISSAASLPKHPSVTTSYEELLKRIGF